MTGRIECNGFDIIGFLEVLEPSQGFPGAADVSCYLASSRSVKKIAGYVGSAEEVPFAQLVAWFPVRRNQTLIPSFAQMGENPLGHHIPAWLPAFLILTRTFNPPCGMIGIRILVRIRLSMLDGGERPKGLY